MESEMLTEAEKLSFLDTAIDLGALALETRELPGFTEEFATRCEKNFSGVVKMVAKLMPEFEGKTPGWYLDELCSYERMYDELKISASMIASEEN